MVIIRETKKSFFQTGQIEKMSGQEPSDTLPETLRSLMQDLLRLGMAGAAGYANRTVARIQLDYIVNPYGRQPPHILVFPDGRAEPMTPFQLPVPGYAPDVLAVELLGVPGSPPTDLQLATVRLFGREVRRLLPGQMAFAGRQELVDTATSALEQPGPEPAPVPAPPAAEDGESNSDAATPFPLAPEEDAPTLDTPAPGPAFMLHETLALSTPNVPRAEPVIFSTKPASVQEIFDIIGTPAERRVPLAPGSIFNGFKPAGRGAPVDASQIRTKFAAPGTREIHRLVVIPSHDPFKPEPDGAQAYSLEELRRADQRLGMTEFRGHYILARNGDLIPGRSLELSGNCWPGKNDNAIQIVLAGNGRTPTPEQRRTLYEYGHLMRRHYERPLKASVRDILMAEGLLGLDPNGTLQEKLANPALIEAPLPQGASKSSRAV